MAQKKYYNEVIGYNIMRLDECCVFPSVKLKLSERMDRTKRGKLHDGIMTH